MCITNSLPVKLRKTSILLNLYFLRKTDYILSSLFEFCPVLSAKVILTVKLKLLPTGICIYLDIYVKKGWGLGSGHEHGPG